MRSMLCLMLGLVICHIATANPADGQELGRGNRDVETKRDAEPKRERRPIATYFVQVAEATTQEEPPAELDDKELLAWLETARKEKKIELMEMVRVSAIDGFDAIAKFGKRVPIVTGTTNTPQGTARNYTINDFGTILRVRAEAVGEEIRVEIDYDASRIEGDAPADGPPKVERTQFNSTVLTKADAPVLLFADSAEKKGRFLILIVEK